MAHNYNLTKKVKNYENFKICKKTKILTSFFNFHSNKVIFVRMKVKENFKNFFLL